MCVYARISVFVAYNINDTVKQKQSRREHRQNRKVSLNVGTVDVITRSYALFKRLLTKLSEVSCLSTDIPARACLCGPSVPFHLEKGDNRSGTTDLR